MTTLHKCPDCFDSRKWAATSPAGVSYEFSCPRCSVSYHGNDELRLDYAQFTESVMKLTIGSVRIDTNDQEHPVSYMCRETGVGSGSVYYEGDLFPTHDEAMAASAVRAAEQNRTTPWVVKQYNKRLSLSDYQLQNAIAKHARDQIAIHSVDLQMLFGDLRNCDTIDEVKDTIERFSFREEAA